MQLIPIQDFFHKNMHIIKRKGIFDRKAFRLQAPSFFFLSGWAYKLVNLFVFETISFKISKN